MRTIDRCTWTNNELTIYLLPTMLCPQPNGTWCPVLVIQVCSTRFQWITLSTASHAVHNQTRWYLIVKRLTSGSVCGIDRGHSDVRAPGWMGRLCTIQIYRAIQFGLVLFCIGYTSSVLRGVILGIYTSGFRPCQRGTQQYECPSASEVSLGCG